MTGKEDKLFITKYYDIYGGLLSVRAVDILKMYYELDLSYAEIAEEYNITRQAVRDIIVRAEEQLKEFDKVLHLIELYSDINELTDIVMGNPTQISIDKIRQLSVSLQNKIN